MTFAETLSFGQQAVENGMHAQSTGSKTLRALPAYQLGLATLLTTSGSTGVLHQVANIAACHHAQVVAALRAMTALPGSL